MSEAAKIPFNHFEIGYQAVDNHAPGFVQGLVPDACAVGLNPLLKPFAAFPDCFGLIL